MIYEYVGNLHLHTTHSDGSATVEEVVRAAQAAGLDFVIPTDHNVYLPGLDGWYGRTLLLIGEEVHDTSRKPQANHYLVFDSYEDMAAYAPNPQQLIKEVQRRGGFGFIAHPFEHAAPRFGEPEIPWVDWQVSGYQGLSIWNYMSEFKSYLRNIPAALWATYFPRTVIRGPFAETLAKWDELLQTRRAPAIGTSDAHGIRYKLGPLRGVIFPYEYLFRAVNLHILSPMPFTGDWRRDKEIVYGAIKAGNSFVAYNLLGQARGFRFTACVGEEVVGPGGEIALAGPVTLAVESPLPARLRLIWRGKVVAEAYGARLSHTVQEPGAYRVEARRRYWGRWRGWVFSNPIYLV
jgi:hypothetical protein